MSDSMDLTGAAWHKSTFSGAGNNCVEVATNLLEQTGHVFVRDTKNPDGAVHQYTRSEWVAFLDGVKDGQFEVRQSSK